jgi:hypothetical protein
MKHKGVTLIWEFFGATLQEIKALTKDDRAQLASAIAREKGFSPGDCEFAHVVY